ncbi:MAG: 30S ribosomal protein S8 [Candidatus Omnitrophica bacterium]|nr:30S ribosomal protein S8 [Candidatus Omnitrophota bacterium]
MALSDPIADALTMIRNASRVRKDRVDIKASGLLAEVVKIFKRERFIYDFRLIEDRRQGILRVYLRKAGEPTRKISHLARVSRPSLRVYAGREKVPVVLGGLGVSILSTSQGVMTGEEAKKKGIGGEVLLKVW